MGSEMCIRDSMCICAKGSRGPGKLRHSNRSCQCALQRCGRVRRAILYVGSIVFASFSAHRHWNSHPQVHLRWGFSSICTRLPQRRCYLGSSSEQSGGRAAKDVHNGGLQQRFWAASMVLTTALPARPVWPIELSEDSLISHVDICRSFKPGSQVILYLGSSGVASNSSQRPCQPYKEARLRWGLASFFTGAPLRAHAFVPVCAC